MTADGSAMSEARARNGAQWQDAPPRSFLLTLLAAAGLGALASSLYIPSLPYIARDLHTTVANAQLTITVYLVAFGLSAVAVGSFSDYLGRRRVMLAGVLFCGLGSAVCIVAPTIEIFFAARVLQAIGACTGLAVTRAALRDRYGRDETPRIMSILSIAMVLVPIAAPILGGYLQKWLGWRADFALLASLAAVLLRPVWLHLPETKPDAQPTGTLIRDVAANVLPLFRNAQFRGYASVVTACGAAYYAFTAVAPAILITHFGLSSDEFGFCGALVMGGTLLGLLLTNRLVSSLGIDRLIFLGAIALTGSGVLAASLSTTPRVWAVVGPLMLMGIGIGLAIPNAHSGAIGSRPESAGAASGLTVFLQTAGAALATGAMAGIEHRSTLPLGLLLVGLGMLALAGWWMTRRSVGN